jgi:DNA-binding transcriptional ArsR family regulator
VPDSRVDLILHPVRMRLLITLARRELTARQLSQLLPDVPQATLYHHLGILTKAGLLSVVSERPVRGTMEKIYTVAVDDASLRPDDLANASREDHLRFFTMFVSTLLSDFSRYLQQDKPIDLFADRVSYGETPFYLSDDELAQASRALNQALSPFLDNQPAPDRQRRLFAFVTFPDAESAKARPDGGPAGDTAEDR